MQTEKKIFAAIVNHGLKNNFLNYSKRFAVAPNK